MAVTFAVGAVTGTVLTFEFGLLWPRFMGQWGEAFGVPFAFEGLFFFTEAIFVAIYIYGWRRLKPWTHFWTGVPLVHHRHPRQRLGRRRQRLDELAVGVHPRLRRQGRRRRPAGGDLQRRDAADGRPHGDRGLRRRRLPHRVGLRVRACCAADETATTASASSSPSASARWPSRSRWASATRSPAGCTTTSRRSSPPSSSSRTPRATSPRPSSATSTPTARSRGGIAIPGLAVLAVRPRHRHRAPSSRASTPCPPMSNPPSPRSTPSTSRGTSWSGSAPCCSCSRSGTGCAGCSAGTCPRAGGSFASPRSPVSPPSSHWKPAGWSARSAASRGSSTTS